ncbi:MAG: N-acetylglucosamine-6-phosphate deacetylase [Aureliella sp.]
MKPDLQTGYIDLQVNGYVGVDFNDPTSTPESIERAAEAMLGDGVRLALPTVITASTEDMCRCIRNIVMAMQRFPSARSCFAGIHLEGPFLSPKPGFIGAHPVEHASPADLGVLESLCEAGGGAVRMVTLDPTVDKDARLTEFCVRQKIRVAAGHTDASLQELERSIEAGLSLFTHLGNACPQRLDRHDNIILRALSFQDRLCYSLIADGTHLPAMIFQSLLRWLPVSRLIVVSDAISAAGLGPGEFTLGKKRVRVGTDLVVRDPDGDNFAGSAARMKDADVWLRDAMTLESLERRKLLCDNAHAFLHRAPVQPGCMKRH